MTATAFDRMDMMKTIERRERPIIFSGEMVRAILDGRKTMTRRVVKPQPQADTVTWGCIGGKGFGFIFGGDTLLQSPFQVGQTLWVREAWASARSLDRTKPSNLQPGFPCEFRAGGCSIAPAYGFKSLADRGRWRPSIHMPRWASRITLEVTDVRVERVQDISHKDAKAEGVHEHNGGAVCLRFESMSLYQHQFANLWDSLNAKRGYSWDSNPYVWVVEFKRVEDEGE